MVYRYNWLANYLLFFLFSGWRSYRCPTQLYRRTFHSSWTSMLWFFKRSIVQKSYMNIDFQFGYTFALYVFHKSELRRQAKLEFIAANLCSHKKYKWKIDNSQSFKPAIMGTVKSYLLLFSMPTYVFLSFFQILERIRWFIMFTVLHTVYKPLLNANRT